MNTKLFIVADFNLLRAYRKCLSETRRTIYLELISEVKLLKSYEKRPDQMTGDPRYHCARNIRLAHNSPNQPWRSNHAMEADNEQQLIDLLAGRINLLLQDDEVGQCTLATNAWIQKRLLMALDSKARAKIELMFESHHPGKDTLDLLPRFEYQQVKA